MHPQLHYIESMNSLGKRRVPFLFMIDFMGENSVVQPLESINPEDLLYDVNGISNARKYSKGKRISLTKKPVPFEIYKHSFDQVIRHIEYGNSYLVNLTFPTEIVTNLALRDIFYTSHAKYRLWYKDQFVVFSPEIFVRLENGKIYSHPMKGTIDANIPDAVKLILSDRKELAEHITIVDLIRNDLGTVANHISVDNFRYIDTIKTVESEILQVSSKISGDLPKGYKDHLGDIFSNLLPAGSVSGAPKAKTLEIISEAEIYNRGYYTGVFGIFDGNNLDSGVMIRYVEREGEKLFYKSGGGITINSHAESEYNEMIKKVYVPAI